MENQTTTTNGAVAFASTLDPRLDLFFKTTRDVGVIPGKDTKKCCNNEPMDNQILFDMIDKSWEVDPLHTMKILFNWRDCRGGKGDHRGFLIAMTHIIDFHSDTFLKNIQNIPEFGSWLDLVKLWHFTSSSIGKKFIMNHIIEELENDVLSLQSDTKKISLLGKWLPSENSKWDRYYPDKERFVLELCKSLFTVNKVESDHIKKYRQKCLVPLRKHLQIVESKMCAKEFDTIKYECVPSVAMSKYRKAFMKRDSERFNEYLELVRSGEKKINSSQVYPHDLVRQYLSRSQDIDPVIEEQWKAIKETVRSTGAFDRSICVCDVSGSMDGTPMEVAIALGLLGLYENKVITFSEDPKLHHIPDGSLYDQVRNMSTMSWGMNTNLERTMDLILGLSCRDKENAIKRIYVFSDMQFDSAFKNPGKSHFQILKEKFESSGVEMPQIVFWNLSSGTNNFPVTCDERGVVMLSGYSPALLSTIIDGVDISPMTMLLKIINNPRYDCISV